MDEMLAILGVLKAGGAYVPLDPGYPRNRLAFLIEDSAMPVVLVGRETEDLVPEGAARVVRLDLSWPRIRTESPDPLPPTAGPQSLAYVIYTSGSTGTPKGAAVPRQAVVRLVRETNYAHLGAREVFGQLAPTAFDASTLEIWGPLLNGGRLVLFPDRLLNPHELGEMLARHRITTLWLTAGLFHQVVDENLPGLAPLSQLLAGGDVLSPPRVRRVLEELPDLRLINGYGPTEGTTFTCCHPIAAAPPPGRALDASIPIGRPIANTRVFISEPWPEPAPVGVFGELWVRGDGLARDYSRRPALTAERFVPDPSAAGAGERLYRTGDLARYLNDGTIEFQGRKDHQVKLRGFRIELGEIEAVLGRHPAVRQAVVLTRAVGTRPHGDEAPAPAGSASDPRLVAYIVPEDGEVPSASDLRQTLTGDLPDYMVPSFFEMLQELPLTPNGKLDRKALASRTLPVPESSDPGAYLAPRTPAEELMAAIWAEVLSVDSVGLEDDFFELGGHSLLAAQVTSRVRSAFGVELSLRTLFEAPTVAALAAELATAGQAPSQPPLDRLASRDAVPLALPQQRLWFLHRLEPNLSVYNMFSGVPISGPLDAAALERALTEVAARHETLRTRFPAVDGDPVQEILPDWRPALPRVDLGRLTAAERRAETQRWADWQASQPYDLSAGPLLRTVLLRLDDDSHVLLLGMHHIISDGWSMGVLVRELTAWYQAVRAGGRPDLPELPIQYADYAAWQQGWLQGEVLEQEVDFWRDQLDGAPAFLSLPTDRPRPPLQSFGGAHLHRLLPPALARQLDALGRQQTATLFMTLLATYQVLLYRLSAQQAIPIGTPIANRNQVELEGLIGFFVNTLVLRSDVTGNPTFSELISRVRTRTLDAFAHPDLPFEKLIEELQPRRDLRYSPLVQTTFALQNVPSERVDFGDLKLGSLAGGDAVAKFDLTLFASAQGDQLALTFEYNTDLFDASTIQRWYGYLRTLLTAVVADPTQPISELELLSAAERGQILWQWNDTRIELPRDLFLHRGFEAIAEKHPDLRAVAFEDQQLSYGQLNRRANRLAHYLRHLEVGPEVRVGVSLERSPELIVAFLAVLKAGGVYLPIDPASPPERLEYLLTDSRLAVLLTQDRPAGAAARQIRILNPEAEQQAIADHSADNPTGTARPENLAYVIYTSGSTGRPKGAQLTHRGLCNMQNELTRTLVSPSDRVMQFSSLSFDASILEMAAPLRAGACLILGRRETLLPSEDFVELLRREAVSWMLVPPSIMAAIPTGQELPALTTLIAGGEACSAELVARWASGRRFWNAYGPTEITVYSNISECRAGQGNPPIGRTVGNARGYLLDRRSHPVPAGVAGELHIGGVGVARGYLGRPRLSAESFVPDLFTRTPGGRLYKTGDLGRYRRNGQIDFAGRADHQIKLRGFRIELGEIEHVLAEHPEVADAVVLAPERRPGDRWLVAYVVPEPGATDGVSDESLLAFLTPKLPAHALPGAFVRLEKLPLLLSGKVDRAALPEPGARARGSAELVAPRGAMERTIAATWQELFEVSEMSVEDNFFDLGGHSLLMVKVQDRLQVTLGRAIPIVKLFEYPTVRSLAGHLSSQGEAPAEAQPEPSRRRTADSEERAESARRRQARRRARRRKSRS